MLHILIDITATALQTLKLTSKHLTKLTSTSVGSLSTYTAYLQYIIDRPSPAGSSQPAVK